MRTFFSALFMVLSAWCSFGQQGYKIDLKIKGLKDTTAYLGFYLEENTHVKDTAKVNNQGAFTFKGSKALPQGIYFIVLGKAIIFEMLVGPNQHFSLETSTADYLKNMVVKGDDDNRVFFENIQFSTALQKEAEPLVKISKDSTLQDEQKKPARESLRKINEKAIAHQQAVLDKYPNTLMARMMKMNKPIDVPNPPKKADGTIDSTFQLRYYRQHYFDNFDLGDEAMLRMNKVYYFDKVKEYLDRLIVPHPDSVTKAINALAAIAKRNQNTYRYFIWNCIVHYQLHSIMGLDEVYVNLVDQYITTGEMDFWLDKKTVKNLQDYANKVRHAMIGRTAPNLIMQNENLQMRSLHDLKNKYTIIFFFKPSCGHCREETPKLVSFYNANKKKFDLEVFAVSTDTALQEMKNFIKEMKTTWITVNGPRTYLKTHFMELYFAETTPTIYILDDKKKIIARKLGVEQLEDFLINYEKTLKKKAAKT
jgi:thiol-disulfide isomerase/thioredoxin